MILLYIHSYSDIYVVRSPYRNHGWVVWVDTKDIQQYGLFHLRQETQIAKFMGPTWGPPGSCRPQMDPMLAPWTLLLGDQLATELAIISVIRTERVTASEAALSSCDGQSCLQPMGIYSVDTGAETLGMTKLHQSLFVYAWVCQMGDNFSIRKELNDINTSCDWFPCDQATTRHGTRHGWFATVYV